MSYVDGYVLTVAKSKFADYEKMASLGGETWTKHGALAYYECAGDDLAPASPEHESEFGKMRNFADMAGASPDDVVVFAFIVFRDKAHRDEVNAAVMADPDMDSAQFDEMPFDMSKIAYAGFKPFVSHGIGQDLFEEQ
jgi:uncharacterized protein YbaA (DUF1428 family)